ncbi:uncharacterized protein K452DRAFT_343795 [Aplosporella prunicola CBS 121167]|uniref:Uncharacterized protein n=1 Tax=Aplosporella prunicola CBS 121167 TaxID=1176127 RepID=A0A6A6BM49_9PEZI|nr:uncharacterized protein K452DRAFT_343795 [Aplosporella prunicola CBS 121167]KAF2145192.1 hypothetical protein K452DRAFT_343795 [Aplosporella prunicola CBS 121167]
MSRLRTLIKNHVQSFYDSTKTSDCNFESRGLSSIVDNRQTVSTLAAAIANSQFRAAALRCLIASVIFSKMALESGPNTTFVSSEVANCLRVIMGSGTNQVQMAFISKWRTMASTMLQPT